MQWFWLNLIRKIDFWPFAPMVPPGAGTNQFEIQMKQKRFSMLIGLAGKGLTIFALNDALVSLKKCGIQI